jgi:hypothetical protein
MQVRETKWARWLYRQSSGEGEDEGACGEANTHGYRHISPLLRDTSRFFRIVPLPEALVPAKYYPLKADVGRSMRKVRYCAVPTPSSYLPLTELE